MTAIRLMAPFRLDRAVFNAGERLTVPDDVATRLVRVGHAALDLVETAAYDAPPADKMLTAATQKSSRHFRRHLRGS